MYNRDVLAIKRRTKTKAMAKKKEEATAGLKTGMIKNKKMNKQTMEGFGQERNGDWPLKMKKKKKMGRKLF